MKVLIEMDLPDDLDLSHVLETMQEVAVEMHEDAAAPDDNDNVDPIDEEAIKSAVSVQAVAAEPTHCTDKHCELPAGHEGVHVMKIRVKQ